MAKRIYHSQHKRLFQHSPGGSYYAFVGSKETCLETNEIVKALKHLEYLDESISYFGAAAFQKKIGDLFPIFLSEKRKETRPRTIQEYEKVWRVFEKAKLDKIPIAKMNQKTWLKFCESSTHNISDFQNHRNLLHQFLVWCEMKEYTRAVPTLKNPKHKRRKRKIIPPNHIIKIFEEAKKSRGGIFLYLTLLALHGPRGVEMRKLLKIHVDLIHHAVTLTEDTVKTDEARQLPLHPIAVELFKHHFKKQEEARIRSKWVFPNAVDPKRYMSDSGFKTAWNTCIRNADLKAYAYTMHDWRATYEKYLEMSHLNEIQKDKASGASAEIRRKTYVHTLTADDLRGAEKVVNVPELIQLLENQTAALTGSTGNKLEDDVSDRS